MIDKEPQFPRILAIVDRPGWAIERKTQNLTRVLAGRFEIITRFQAEVSESDLDAADLILVYYWLELLKMQIPVEAFERRRDKLVMGICSHYELDGPRRDQGLDLLRRLPRAIFVNNRALQNTFAPLFDQPVYYTPNGVDTGFFHPIESTNLRRPGTLRVGWAGSLTNQGAAHRGFHDIIEPAVASLPGATLVTAIREECWRPQSEMPHFYRGLDAYVCASVSEGTPNPCLEAAACGIPLVTTRVGNMPEFVRNGENGFFIERQADDLAAKLRLLRDSPDVCGRLSACARQTALDWDWTLQANNYAHMFQELL